MSQKPTRLKQLCKESPALKNKLTELVLAGSFDSKDIIGDELTVCQKAVKDALIKLGGRAKVRDVASLAKLDYMYTFCCLDRLDCFKKVGKAEYKLI